MARREKPVVVVKSGMMGHRLVMLRYLTSPLQKHGIQDMSAKDDTALTTRFKGLPSTLNLSIEQRVNGRPRLQDDGELQDMAERKEEESSVLVSHSKT